MTVWQDKTSHTFFNTMGQEEERWTRHTMSSSHKYIQSKHGRGWSWRSGYYEIHMKLRKVFKYVSWFLVEGSISTLTKCISTQDVQEEHSTFQRFPCWTNHKLLWMERTWASTHYVKKLTLCRAVLKNLPPSFFSFKWASTDNGLHVVRREWRGGGAKWNQNLLICTQPTAWHSTEVDNLKGKLLQKNT